MAYKIILQVFSGRENPEWALPETLLPIVVNYVKKAIVTKPPKKHYVGLGYNGFVIATGVQQWHIFNRIITHTNNGATSYKLDAARALEIALQKTVPEEYQDIIPNLKEQ